MLHLIDNQYISEKIIIYFIDETPSISWNSKLGKFVCSFYLPYNIISLHFLFLLCNVIWGKSIYEIEVSEEFQIRIDNPIK